MTEYTAYGEKDNWSIETYVDGHHTIVDDALADTAVKVWLAVTLKPGDVFTWENPEDEPRRKK